jgi:hypothetical protein
MCAISNFHNRPVAYQLLDDRVKAVVRETHATLTRMRTAK